MITIVISLLRNATQESWTNNTGSTIKIKYTVSYNNGTEEVYEVDIPNGSNINLSRRTFTLRSSGRIITNIGGPRDDLMLPFSFKVTCNNTNGTTKIDRLIKRFSHLGDFTMRNLKEVTLIKGNFNKVTSLQNSFSGCDYVTRVRIPDTVINIRNMNRTFYGCARLIQFLHLGGAGINDNINDMDYMLYQCSNFRGLRYEYATGQLNAMERIMYNCTSATTGMVPSNVRGVTSLLESFAFCTRLGETNINGQMDNLTTMRRFCYIPTGLSGSLTTAGSLTSAARLNDMFEAFHLCTSLRSFNIPANATGITNMGWTFHGCRSITSISVQSNWDNVTRMDKCFSDLRNVRSIGRLPSSFANCTDMDRAFQSCGITSLNITYAPRVTSINSICNHCLNLTSVSLPNEMNALQDMAYSFWVCNRLSSLKLPSSMSSLRTAEAAFNGAGPATITLPASLPQLTNMNHFINSNIFVSVVNMPTSAPNLSLMNSFAFSAKELRSIVLPNDANRITSMTNAFIGCHNLTTATLPANTNSLRDMFRAFHSCTSLSNLGLPSSAPSLSNLKETFTNCERLPSIALPSNATGITTLESAFQNCVAATTIALPSTLGSLSTLEKTFSGCRNLSTISGPASFPNVSNMRYTFNACTRFDQDLAGLQTPRIQYNAGNFASVTTGWDNGTTAWNLLKKPRFGKPIEVGGIEGGG